MLAHRLRRWPNIEQTSGRCVVFAGIVLNYSVDTKTDIDQTLHCLLVIPIHTQENSFKISMTCDKII